MSQTLIPTTVLKQNNYAVGATDLNLALTAIDTVNGNSFQATGREVLVFENTDASAHTVTITSVNDNLGRLDTSLTNYSIPANATIAIQMKFLPGWLQSNGLVYISGASALVKVAVLQTN